MSGIRGIDIGLLKFCLEHHDSPNIDGVESDAKPMSPEDREWLNKVMASIKDDTSRIKSCLEVVRDEKSTNSEKLVALDELILLVELIDNAIYIAKLGFGEICATMELKENNNNNNSSNIDDVPLSDVRSHACWVLTTILQNNAMSQNAAVEQGVIRRLLLFISKEKNGKVLAKALSAFSASFRDCKAAQLVIEPALRDIYRLLLPLIKHNNTRTQTKAIVTINHLIEQIPEKSGEVLTNNDCEVANNLVSELLNAMQTSTDYNVKERSIITLESLISTLKSTKQNIEKLNCTLIRESLAKRVAAIAKLTGEERDDADSELETCKQIFALLK